MIKNGRTLSLFPPHCQSPECDSDSLVNYWTANNLPMCEAEMTAYAKFMCGLADDVSNLSADDVRALWELEGGDSKTPGTVCSGTPLVQIISMNKNVKYKSQTGS